MSVKTYSLKKLNIFNYSSSIQDSIFKCVIFLQLLMNHPLYFFTHLDDVKVYISPKQIVLTPVEFLNC